MMKTCYTRYSGVLFLAWGYRNMLKKRPTPISLSFEENGSRISTRDPEQFLEYTKLKGISCKGNHCTKMFIMQE
jgi:hypothetical protein